MIFDKIAIFLLEEQDSLKLLLVAFQALVVLLLEFRVLKKIDRKTCTYVQILNLYNTKFHVKFKSILFLNFRAISLYFHLNRSITLPTYTKRKTRSKSKTSRAGYKSIIHEVRTYVLYQKTKY